MFLRQVLTICAKDLRAELRTKEALNSSLAFALTILLLFSFAFDPGADQIKEISGGLLWMSYAFAGALILNRSFARELFNDCLDALVFSPVPGAALFLGKSLASYALLLIVELACLPVFGIFYNMPWWDLFGWHLFVMLIASWALTVVGTMFSALTVNLRLRELMLPMLLYPMMIPALMAAMHLTTLLMAGQGITGDHWTWVRLLVGIDIIFTALGVALVEIVLVG